MSCFTQAISHRWHSLSAKSIVIFWLWLLEFSLLGPLDTAPAVMREHYVRCYLGHLLTRSEQKVKRNVTVAEFAGGSVYLSEQQSRISSRDTRWERLNVVH